MRLPVSKLLIVIADRCPWHVLLVDKMSVKLREQGVICGVIGLVEQGILDAVHIAGLRRLADKTGGAWDLANGRELSDAIHTLGLHLYHKLGNSVTSCEIVGLDHGHLSLFRDGVETGIRRLTEDLAREELMTDLVFHWRSLPASRLGQVAKEPAIRPWSPARLDLSADPKHSMAEKKADASNHGARPLDRRSADREWTTRHAGNSVHAQEPGLRPTPLGQVPSSSVTDRVIQWGLWLSGGALLSALTLLAKK